MPVRTYDPKQVIITIGGIPMSGFADGTFVTVMRESDTFEKVSGADGVVTRAKQNDFSGNMTLSLAQSSPSNDVLTAFAKTDEVSNDGIVPVVIKDFSGRSVYVSAFGWIRKPPDSEFGKSINNRDWILDLADLDVFIGGNANFEG